MLDVHILLLNKNEQWVEECLKSAKIACINAGYPVKVHCIPGIKGNLCVARQRGYSLGQYNHVTYIDDDDYIFPNAFKVLREGLDANKKAIFTKELMIKDGIVKQQIYTRHHLAVYRRDMIIKLVGQSCDREQVRSIQDDFLLIDEPVYVWRRYDKAKS